METLLILTILGLGFLAFLFYFTFQVQKGVNHEMWKRVNELEEKVDDLEFPNKVEE